MTLEQIDFIQSINQFKSFASLFFSLFIHFSPYHLDDDANRSKKKE